MLTIPCSRPFCPPGEPMTTCRDGQLCGNCAAIRILKAACSEVAYRLEHMPGEDDMDDLQLDILHSGIGRLRADVARAEGQT